jgi:hypothetical protein
MRDLAIVYAMLVVATVSFAVVSWAVARLVGARVTVIGIGTPASVRIRAGEPEMWVGPLPSGFIELHGRAPDADDGDPRSWKRLGLASRLLVLLGPWGVAFAIAIVCVGPARAFRSLARGFEQLLLTVDVAPLVRSFLDMVASAPLSTTFGVVLAKMVAGNLLPFGGFAGGGAIQELLSPRPPRALRIYLTVTMLLAMLWIAGRFGWAIVRVAL